MIRRRAELERRFSRRSASPGEAGALALRHFRDRAKRSASTMKGAQDWLTAADGEVETLIRERLRASFPGATASSARRAAASFDADVWIIDPIDGTANFARGIANWCISIGFLRDGEPRSASSTTRCQGELYAARRGARRDAERRADAGVAARRHRAAPPSSRLVDAPAARALRRRWCERVLEAGAGVRRGGSGALGLAYVADGPHRRLLRAAHQRLGRRGRHRHRRGGRRLDQRFFRRRRPAARAIRSSRCTPRPLRTSWRRAMARQGLLRPAAATTLTDAPVRR